MSLSYGKQTEKYIIGTATTPHTLTTSHLAAGGFSILSLGGLSEITLLVSYTPTNSGNSLQIRFRGSADGPESASPKMYQEVVASISSGTVTLTPAEYNYAPAATSEKTIRVLIPVADITGEISVKETVAGGTAGAVSVRIIESGTGSE